jgi:dipeptidyl-peptidase 4
MKRLSIIKLIFWLSIIITVNISVSAQNKRISLDDLFKNYTLYDKSIEGIESMNDGESYSVLEDDSRITRYDYSSGKLLSVLFDPNSFKMYSIKHIDNYSLSNDDSKIMIATNTSNIYRHSNKATYFVYDLKAKTLMPLTDGDQVMLATFSPDGKIVSYIRDNNIYIKDLSTKVEKPVTTDGKHNSIINGAPDWLYEEEFSLLTAMQWSPDSKKLAFLRFDESEVKQFNMTKFKGNLYPENYTFKYPKAGEKNSIVSVHIYNTETSKTTKLDVGSETDQYIARIKWPYSSDQISIIRLNRLQNKMDILLADVYSGESRSLYSEENKYYLPEPTDNLITFTEDGKSFIITSEKSGYNHIYIYGIDGNLVKQLTTGNNEITKVYGYDAKSKRVFYQAFDQSPLRTGIYSVKTDNLETTKLSPLVGSNSAEFSKSFKYFILFSSNSTTPTIISVVNEKGKQIRIIEDNSKLKGILSSYDIPTKEFFTFKTSEGTLLNGFIIKPLGFNPLMKYPVLMTQYSGPGSISVIDEWSIGWDQYLASNGYIVACVDGRGTGGRGESFRKMTYGQLGYYESIDQIESAKYLASLGYVDPARIGIWGWSYGGYMSTLCLFKGADIFKMAIAVAPVTNWRFYDSVYTERFMGLPQDNPLGYDSNSPINYVDRLKGKLLIVHGTGDDNVHLQNSMEMIEKLVQANKQFDMMFYPDKNHGIYGGNTSLHLFTKLTNYLKENL